MYMILWGQFVKNVEFSRIEKNELLEPKFVL